MQDRSQQEQDAWEGFVSSQSVADFLEISAEKNLPTVEVAVAAYVAELREHPHGMGLTAEEIPDDLERLLERYIYDQRRTT